MPLAPVYLILLVAATVVVHALGTTWWLSRLRARRRNRSALPAHWAVISALVQTALLLIGLHVIEIALWALLLQFLPGGGLSSFSEAMYLSFATFTTLGYGDVVVDGPWRWVTGVEALNGVVLLGWSTALSFAVIQRIWERAHQPEESEPAN